MNLRWTTSSNRASIHICHLPNYCSPKQWGFPFLNSALMNTWRSDFWVAEGVLERKKETLINVTVGHLDDQGASPRFSTNENQAPAVFSERKMCSLCVYDRNRKLYFPSFEILRSAAKRNPQRLFTLLCPATCMSTLNALTEPSVHAL